VQVQPIEINAQQTQVTPTYTWSIVKAFTNGADTLALTIPVDGTGTASYRILVNKQLQTQAVTVGGSFDLLNTNGSAPAGFSQPQLTFPSAMGGVNSQVICNPTSPIPAGGRSTCRFSASWTDSNIMAASTGTMTVTVTSTDDSSMSIMVQQYTPGLAETGSSAIVSDEFTGGDITSSNVQISGNRPTGIPVRDSSDYSYTVTFQNFGSSSCVRPLTVRDSCAEIGCDVSSPTTAAMAALIDQQCT
jgi:hypothetical protein